MLWSYHILLYLLLLYYFYNILYYIGIVHFILLYDNAFWKQFEI